MPSTAWQEANRLPPHPTSPNEIQEILAKAAHDLAVARQQKDDEWRLVIAYNAVLRLAAAALYATGFTIAKGESHHVKLIQSLEHTIGVAPATIDALDQFRRKRAASVYDVAGNISPAEAAAMVRLATDLEQTTRKWLQAHFPILLA